MTKYITVKLTEDQIRHAVVCLDSCNERTKRIIDTPEAFNEPSIELAKQRYAFRKRLMTKLQAELVR